MSASQFPLDFAQLTKDRRPRCFLVLPSGFESTADADMESPVFACEADALLDQFTSIALSQARVSETARNDAQREFVQTSAVFKFPDVITVEAVSVDGGFALAVYSRAKIGHYDFRVNEKRVRAWIAATAEAISV